MECLWIKKQDVFTSARVFDAATDMTCQYPSREILSRWGAAAKFTSWQRTNKMFRKCCNASRPENSQNLMIFALYRQKANSETTLASNY